jgi:hypothetical protein
MKMRIREGLVALVLIVCGSAMAADVELPNGYSIVESQPNEHNLVRGAEVVVFGNVEQYGVLGNVVVGFVTKPPAPKAEPDYNSDVRAGHFFLDVQTGMLATGLDEKSWAILLSKFGVSKLPVLKPTCPDK